MPNVKSFNDTSAVSLAYTLGSGATAADFSGKPFKYLPYTTEGFQMSKEPKMSTAITSSRRPNNSKNTKGTASGAATIEFGGTDFALDMLSASLMADWEDVDPADPTAGKFLTDGDVKKFMCVEKTSKTGPGAADVQYHERFFGCAVNDTTLEFGDGELITMAMNFMAVFADYAEAAAGPAGLGGSLASEKAVPADYEIADSSNNLKSITVRNEDGEAMELTFSDLSIQIQNNAREQPGLGKEFAAGVGFGRVAVTLTGEVYFYDHTLLKAHMTNKRLSAGFSIQTREGAFFFELPNLMVQTPTSNSEGENQDYKTSLTLSAEAGQVVLGGEERECVVAVTFVPA